MLLLLLSWCVFVIIAAEFARVASVSQISVSATLLVLAEGNYEIGFEGENLVVLCIEMRVQIKYVKCLQTLSRIASAFVKFKHEGRGKK